jgi:hypothetical protein
MQTKTQLRQRLVVLAAGTVVLYLMLWFWDTSGNIVGRIIVGGLSGVLFVGFMVVGSLEWARQRREDTQP